MKLRFDSLLRPMPGAVLIFTLTVGAFAQEAPPPGAPPGTIATKAFTRNRVISILPDTKRALVLKSDERNPFARRNPDVDLITEDSEQETEADLIRDKLTSLPITGRTYGPKGLRILAGEIVFERGKTVDPVIENQTENLRVENIDDTTIELAWIDLETGKLTGKQLKLFYDLSPKVRFLLKGQEAGDDLVADRKYGVFHPDHSLPIAERQDQAEEQEPAELPNGISQKAFQEGQ
ncbi:MAG: hypothetical protein KDM63_00810 [Verrucomicrobiae bacterium]|nr:hypothetical protein [Verrucomicrobiae bacterium]